ADPQGGVMATVEPGTTRTGRARELGLLVGAVVLGMGAFAQVELAMNDTLPADFYLSTAGLVVLATALHLLVRRVAPFADQVILPVAVALNGIGLAMIHRLDLAEQASGRTSELAGKQLGITAVG